ncbi:MAG: KilA-N domain-containing protein [Methylomicrobium sp.]
MSTNKTKYEIISIDNVDLTVDVSLLKDEVLWFNATEIAKQFEKRPDDFLRLKSTNEYIEELLLESGYGNSRNEILVEVVQGGKHQGTWLHKELAFEFAGWCSALFRRKLHKWAEQRIKGELIRKALRLELKTGFLPLTEAIQAAHGEPQAYHYSNECNLINRLVTGMDAKTFKAIRNVENVRDGLTVAEAQLMERLQRQDTSLIEMGFSYEDRKRLLTAQAMSCKAIDTLEAKAAATAKAQKPMSQSAKLTHITL